MITSGYKNLVKQVITSSEHEQGLLPIKDVNGTIRYLAGYSAYPYTVTTVFTTTASTAGISIGSSNTSITEDNYQLGNTITDNISGSVDVTKSIDVNGNSIIEFEVTITNIGSDSISIAEIGYKQQFSASDTQSGTTTTNRVFLIDRTILNNPISLNSNSQCVIRYSLQTVFNNETGVEDVQIDGISVVDTDNIAQIDSDSFIRVSDVEVNGISVVNNKIAEIIIPEIPVEDVYVDGISVVDQSGIAQIDLPDIPSTIVEDVEVDGISVVNQYGVAEIVMPTIIDIEANPSETATDELETILIGETVYNIPQGGSGSTVSYNGDLQNGTLVGTLTIDDVPYNLYCTEVEANPQGSPTVALSSIEIDGVVYSIQGGGTTVIANPQGQATADLSKIQIGNNIYGVATPTDIATLQANFQDGVDDIYDACVTKGSTPTSHTLSDVVQGILNIPQSGVGGNIQWYYPSDLLPVLTEPDDSVVTASSTYGNYEPWKALDNNDNTYWCSATNSNTDWIKFHLSIPVYISVLMFLRWENNDVNFTIFDDDRNQIIARLSSSAIQYHADYAVFEGTAKWKVQNIRIQSSDENRWKALTAVRIWGFDLSES